MKILRKFNLSTISCNMSLVESGYFLSLLTQYFMLFPLKQADDCVSCMLCTKCPTNLGKKLDCMVIKFSSDFENL